MKNLKQKLHRDCNDPSIMTEILYYVCFSKPEKHTHPVWTTFMNQELNATLKEEIRKHVRAGITHIRTIKVLLQSWVREKVASNINNKSRAVFPTNRIIRNYVLKYTYESKQSKVDQVALGYKIDHWQRQSADAKYYHRPYCQEKSESFMFSTNDMQQH